MVLAATILIGIVVWASRLGASPGSRRGEDLLYVVLGMIPGALVGGRLVHGLVFADVYLAEPAALFELSRGSLSLLGATLGGALAGAYVCRLLGHRVGHWADAGALPLLLVIGAGKLAMVVGGSGQGAPFDGPWAVAFAGPGPWVSADAATPAHPAQLYEGLWTLAGGAVVGFASRARRRHPDGRGRLFLGAVAWWLVGRTLAGFTWRDERAVGPLGAEQALGAAVLVLVVGLLALQAWRRAGQTEGVAGP